MTWMLWALVAILAVIFGIVPVSFLIACLLAEAWDRIRDWRRSRRAPIDALAKAVTCTWCRPRGVMPCTCGRACIYIRCTGQSDVLPGGWTAADMAWLNDTSKEIPR